MKVYELIARLMEFPAGTDVFVSHEYGDYTSELHVVHDETDSEYIQLVGDGEGLREREIEESSE